MPASRSLTHQYKRTRTGVSVQRFPWLPAPLTPHSVPKSGCVPPRSARARFWLSLLPSPCILPAVGRGGGHPAERSRESSFFIPSWPAEPGVGETKRSSGFAAARNQLRWLPLLLPPSLKANSTQEASGFQSRQFFHMNVSFDRVLCRVHLSQLASIFSSRSVVKNPKIL